MNDGNWQRARLIPMHLPGEQGTAASAVLAVIGAVEEFGRAVTGPLGAPDGPIDTYADVPFPVGRGGPGARVSVQDGLIQVGQGRWTALVHVRTGAAGLDAERLEEALDIAHQQGFDVVLTISNELPGRAGRHPVAVQPGRLRGAGLLHYSWCHLLAEAVTQKDHGLVADPDQGWVLAELIRFLEHPLSGVLEIDDGVDPVVGPVVAPLDLSPGGPPPTRPVPVPGRSEGAAPDGRPVSVLHQVHPQRTAPPSSPVRPLPSRRELRVVRRLAAEVTGQEGVSSDAGWYQDPTQTGQLRWWDGSGWTERTYPAQPALA